MLCLSSDTSCVLNGNWVGGGVDDFEKREEERLSKDIISVGLGCSYLSPAETTKKTRVVLSAAVHVCRFAFAQRTAIVPVPVNILTTPLHSNAVFILLCLTFDVVVSFLSSTYFQLPCIPRILQHLRRTFPEMNINHQLSDSAARTFIVLLGITLYNVLELTVLIATTFKTRQGLYFWSFVVTTLGTALNAIGIILQSYEFEIPNVVYNTFNMVGWVCGCSLGRAQISSDVPQLW
jgi:hypothetical protein